MRFSLREILIVTTLTAGAMPLLMFASAYTRGAAVAVTAVLGFAMVVRALIERGERQASAGGFVLVAGLYAAIILLAGNSKDVNPYSSRFPTVQVLQAPLTWMQQARGSDDPPTQGVPSVVWASRFSRARPLIVDFVTTAHCLWALLLGYLGAKYASFVYARRKGREQRVREQNNAA